MSILLPKRTELRDHRREHWALLSGPRDRRCQIFGRDGRRSGFRAIAWAGNPELAGDCGYAGAASIIEIGIHMVSAPDQRWRRRDIKSVGLMGSVFAKMAARDAGAQEALLHEDGVVTEGAATSFFCIRAGALVTRPLSEAILPGCTRKALVALVEEHGLRVDERLFTLSEAKTADEAFITGASTYVCPVLSIDDAQLGDGRPGPLTRRLQTLYASLARANAI